MSFRQVTVFDRNRIVDSLLGWKQLRAASKAIDHRSFSISVPNAQNNAHSLEGSGSMPYPLAKDTEGAFKLHFMKQVKRTMYSLKDFYDDFTGNASVRASQDKVNDMQNKLSVVLERRSITELELLAVKQKVTDLNAAQHMVTREDINYFELIRNEFLLLSEKQRLENTMEVLAFEHQVLLLQLTHALSDVHAKERQEVSNVRVIKLLMTAVIAVLGFAGNAGYNHYKDAKVERHMATQSLMMKEVADYVKSEKSRQSRPSESWGGYLYRQPVRFYRYMFPKQS